VLIRFVVATFVTVWGLAGIAAEEGFEDLLEGGTLAKWNNSGNYELKDGVVRGSKGRLFSKKEYANFVLRFEFQLQDGTNNGLAIRTPAKGRPIELQIIDNKAKKYAKIKEWQKHGSLYNYVPAKTGFLKPTGEWNEQEVTCNGSMVTVKLNGTVIMEADLKTVKPISDSYVINYVNKAEQGHVGLLGHNSPVAVRKVRIKELP
jgi:hypothetical protein